MTVMEKSRFRIDSSYGYGPEGDDTLGVPPNAMVFYEVELHSFDTVRQSAITITITIPTAETFIFTITIFMKWS